MSVEDFFRCEVESSFTLNVPFTLITATTDFMACAKATHFHAGQQLRGWGASGRTFVHHKQWFVAPTERRYISNKQDCDVERVTAS
jgi:hypothetical protein